MPLIKRREDAETQTGVWRMTESLAELEGRYAVGADEMPTYAAFRNDRRRKEWLTVRILLSEMAGAGVGIAYLPSGKPYLVGSDLFISITHTIGYVGIRLGRRPVALDMEYRSERVLKLIPRFVSEAEMRFIAPDNKETTALIIWSAKETLYKLFDRADLLFDEHLSVDNLVVDGEAGDFVGRVRTDALRAEVGLHYRLIDDLIIVYC